MADIVVKRSHGRRSGPKWHALAVVLTLAEGLNRLCRNPNLAPAWWRKKLQDNKNNKSTASATAYGQTAQGSNDVPQFSFLLAVLSDRMV
jgi:hypothetical protein